MINILSITVLPFSLRFMYCHAWRVETTKACCVCVYSMCVEGGGGPGGVQTHRLITQDCRRSQRHCTLAASIQATTSEFCVKVITAWMQRYGEQTAEEGAGERWERRDTQLGTHTRAFHNKCRWDITRSPRSLPTCPSCFTVGAVYRGVNENKVDLIMMTFNGGG